MSQQFRIESESLRDKINRLLPSQSRGGIDVDLSGSTTIIPIVDLTETAEGSALRQDLQTSLSLTSASAFSVANTTTTIINTTGYYRLFGSMYILSGASGNTSGLIQITDGTTTKNVFGAEAEALSGQDGNIITFDFIVFLEAGDSVNIVSNSANARIVGSSRQIADISGNLINP